MRDAPCEDAEALELLCLLYLILQLALFLFGPLPVREVAGHGQHHRLATEHKLLRAQLHGDPSPVVPHERALEKVG